MQKTSLTPAGLTETQSGLKEHRIAINQTFGLFRINYHNQYYSAFPNEETLAPVKKLWLESLQTFSPDIILRAAKRVIESSEYLPSLHKMIDTCWQVSGTGLPDVHAAYLEACRASSPKQNADWSHPAVYHAGKRCDWYFLASAPEKLTYPLFKRHYQAILEEIQQGKSVPNPTKTVTDSKIQQKTLDKQHALEKIAAIKEKLGF